MSVKIFSEGGVADLRLRLMSGQRGVSLAAVDEDGDVISYLLGIGEKDGGHSLTLYSYVGSEHGFPQDEAGTIIPELEGEGSWEPEEDDLYDDGESEDADDDEEDSRESDAPRRVLPWAPGITTGPNDVLLDIETDGTLHVVDGKGKHIPGGYLAHFYREGVLRYSHVNCRSGFSSDARHALDASKLKPTYSKETTAISGRRLKLERREGGTLLRGIDEDGDRIPGGNIVFFHDDGRVYWHPHISRDVDIATDDKDGRVIDLL